MKRTAASPKFFEALEQRFKSTGLDSGAAGHLAAEVSVHGSEAADLDRIRQEQERFRAAGFPPAAADQLAVEVGEEGY